MSSEALCPYLDAKYIPPPIITTATSRAAGSARATPTRDSGFPSPPITMGTPTMAAMGARTRSSGVTLAQKTALMYLLRSSEEVFTIHNLSFSSHPLAFPEPNEPTMEENEQERCRRGLEGPG